MNSGYSPSDPDSLLFPPETQAEITRRFGSPMADLLASSVGRALKGIAADAEAAGLESETAVAGFLHGCREFCKGLQEQRDGSGGLN